MPLLFRMLLCFQHPVLGLGDFFRICSSPIFMHIRYYILIVTASILFMVQTKYILFALLLASVFLYIILIFLYIRKIHFLYIILIFIITFFYFFINIFLLLFFSPNNVFLQLLVLFNYYFALFWSIIEVCKSVVNFIFHIAAIILTIIAYLWSILYAMCSCSFLLL